MIVPHQLHLTKSQITKIKKGLPIQIKFNDMGSDKGEIVIGLKDGNAKKLMSAFKKGKGVRIEMDEDEVDYSTKEGRGFGSFIKKTTSKAKSGLSKASKSIEKTSNTIAKPVKAGIKKYVPEPVRKVIKDEAQGLINTTGDTLGEMVGSATGDEELGDMVSSAVKETGENLLEGKKLNMGSKILPIAKKSVNVAVDKIEDPKYKMIAKAVVKEAGAGLYGQAGDGLTGAGLTGAGLRGDGLRGNGIPKHALKPSKPTTMPVKKRKPRFEKGSQEAKDYMASIRAGKKGEGFGSFVKKEGKTVKKTASKAGDSSLSAARATKKGVFGNRMSDEMEYVLPAVGGIMGGVAGMASGPMGSAVGSSAGAAGGQYLAADMKKRGYGTRRTKSAPPTRGKKVHIKPASDLMTMSPYQVISSPAFSPFYPKDSFQNGGSGENKK